MYTAPTKKASSAGAGTLSRRTRRGHGSALSSSSTASDRSESVYPDENGRMLLSNGKMMNHLFTEIIKLVFHVDWIALINNIT